MAYVGHGPPRTPLSAYAGQFGLPASIGHNSERPGYEPASDEELGVGMMHSEYVHAYSADWHELNELFNSVRSLWDPKKILQALTAYVVRQSTPASNKEGMRKARALRGAIMKILSNRGQNKLKKLARLRALGIDVEPRGPATEYPVDDCGQGDFGFP